MNKTINDFIEYAHTNLIWFAFNTVLILMPIVCIFVLNENAENLDIKGATMSYTSLLTIVCLANLLQFVLRPRIFILEKKSHLYSNEDKKPATQSIIGTKSGMSLSNIINTAKNSSSEVKLAKKDDSADIGKTEKDLIRDDDDEKNHYVWMTPRFNEDKMWVWIVNLIAYIAVITTYFCV